jgi:phosphoribulokinase
MSAEHPIVAIISPSGAGSSSVTKAFEHIFWRERVKAVYIQGSAFHRYDRKQMQQEILNAKVQGQVLSHYGPEGNHLDKLESLFFEYAAVGTGLARYYLHSQKFAEQYGQEPGTFTPWKKLPKKSDLLLYRGLHGAAVWEDVDISQYPDLMIGIAPNVNLEWIRKIKRDYTLRGYTPGQVRETIVERMKDYVEHITPQFSRTHINFQMIPVVDTSDPFSVMNEPSEEECYLVINFQKTENPDFFRLLHLIPEAVMSGNKTILVPGNQMVHVLEVILMPLIHQLVKTSRKLRNIDKLPKKKESGLLGAMHQSF